MKEYQIIENGVVTGRFMEEIDRDKAFNRYILPRSANCMKSEIYID